MSGTVNINLIGYEIKNRILTKQIRDCRMSSDGILLIKHFKNIILRVLNDDDDDTTLELFSEFPNFCVIGRFNARDGEHDHFRNDFR